MALTQHYLVGAKVHGTNESKGRTTDSEKKFKPDKRARRSVYKGANIT